MRWTLFLGATAFGVFTMFWTALTFLLSAQPFSYSVSVIGLFGLIGLAGALAAQRAGVLHDRGWSLPATGWGWAAIVGSFVVAAFSARSVAGIIVAVVLLDIAVQGVNILNQTRLFAIAPEARSRLNTAFITCNFIGGAIGSAIASALGAIAFLVWALGRRGPFLATRAHRTPWPGAPASAFSAQQWDQHGGIPSRRLRIGFGIGRELTGRPTPAVVYRQGACARWACRCTERAFARAMDRRWGSRPAWLVFHQQWASGENAVLGTLSMASW